MSFVLSNFCCCIQSLFTCVTVTWERILCNIIPEYKLILGHAGWSSGELEREIENGDWLLQSTTRDFVFKVPADQMWRQAVGSIGVDLDPVSGIGGQA